MSARSTPPRAGETYWADGRPHRIVETIEGPYEDGSWLMDVGGLEALQEGVWDHRRMVWVHLVQGEEEEEEA